MKEWGPSFASIETAAYDSCCIKLFLTVRPGNRNIAACIQTGYGTSAEKLETSLKEKCATAASSASNALTTKLIQQAGFPAYQIGGFALDGMRFGSRDMDVNRLGEESAEVRNIVHASDLPVLVDCDDECWEHSQKKSLLLTFSSLLKPIPGEVLTLLGDETSAA